MSVFEYIEDFDNGELSTYNWVEQMLDAVRDYNFEHGTLHEPAIILAQYSSMSKQGVYGGRGSKN